MVVITLSVNGKPAMIEKANILFAEEIESERISFTRIYLKQPIPGEDETLFVDVKETVNHLAKAMK